MICPEEFEERLAQVGGRNQYGDPMFRMAWGEHETFLGGGYWRKDGFTGYREILLGHGDPCWMILMWEAPEMYGSPAAYYYDNKDEGTGLQTLGEYPYHGRYRLLHKLMHRELVNGELKLDMMPLSDMILTLLVPIVKAWRGVSEEQKRAVAGLRREREAAERSTLIEDSKHAAAPAFGGRTASFAGQRSKISTVMQKAAMIERYWDVNLANIRKLGKGFQQQS